MFCSKCGQQIEENSPFCSKCGNPTGAKSPVANNVSQQVRSGAANKLHCPNCKSHNISITTESSVSGAVTTSYGNMAATSVSNTHRNFWICTDCGTKFRNIQNLEEEIAKTRKSQTIVKVVSIIAIIIFVLMLVMLLDNPFMVLFLGSFMFVSFVVAIVCFCFIFVYGKRARKMEAERDYLKQNCFD